MATPPPPSPIAIEANSRGLAAMREGDFAAAVPLFERAIAADPSAVSLHLNLAHAHRQLGQAEGEQRALEAALNIDRTDLGALIRLAQLFERRDDSRNAMIQWSGLIQLTSGVPDLSPELAAIFDHAQAYVAQQTERLQHSVNARLGPQLDQLAGLEQRRARAFVDHAVGLRRIYRNECAGLYYPFLPADEFFDETHFPWFAQLSASADAIRAEVTALLADPGDALRPYVRLDKGVPDNKWTALDDRLDWGACFLWEYGQPNQAVLDRCPVTSAVLAAVPSAHIPGRAPSAFFSILKPHTRIPPHTGVSNTRAIIHLPLVVPQGCGFRVGGETRQWVEGVPFAFDDTIDHEAWNDSDEVRIVLIFDVWNPHLSAAEQAIIADYCATADQVTAIVA